MRRDDDRVRPDRRDARPGNARGIPHPRDEVRIAWRQARGSARDAARRRTGAARGRPARLGGLLGTPLLPGAVSAAGPGHRGIRLRQARHRRLGWRVHAGLLPARIGRGGGARRGAAARRSARRARRLRRRQPGRLDRAARGDAGARRFRAGRLWHGRGTARRGRGRGPAEPDRPRLRRRRARAGEGDHRCDRSRDRLGLP